MADVYLGLGSNLGDREAKLQGALAAIDALPGTAIANASPIYETSPMGPQDQGAYMNMAAKITTSLAPSALITALQRVESALGRAAPERRQHWGPREIDIDVLLIDGNVIDEPGLTVPHPGLHERWFVLKPLADIAPDLLHPLQGLSIAGLLVQVGEPASQEAHP
ncbi:MAG: 2-amino-4-hydroxy-6-hydroxymethyldihydropteridine diphosphokinase [Phycisphaeraceae bacterium]|nr:2-amino-4-hydroxy-6-hydroxymethyldihydropteridine diphosphokinase [Phycisphaeraceae bacterium]